MKPLISVSNALFSSCGDMPGISFGVSLVDTVEVLTVPDYFSNSTFEQYSVAEILGHLMYCKWHLLKSVATTFDEEYPFPVGIQGFHRDWNRTQRQKQLQIEYIRRIHGLLMEEIVRIPEQKFSAKIGGWNMTIVEAVYWICQHDIYHLGQIRNMGINALAEGNVMDTRKKII